MRHLSLLRAFQYSPERNGGAAALRASIPHIAAGCQVTSDSVRHACGLDIHEEDALLLADALDDPASIACLWTLAHRGQTPLAPIIEALWEEPLPLHSDHWRLRGALRGMGHPTCIHNDRGEPLDLYLPGGVCYLLFDATTLKLSYTSQTALLLDKHPSTGGRHEIQALQRALRPIDQENFRWLSTWALLEGGPRWTFLANLLRASP